MRVLALLLGLVVLLAPAPAHAHAMRSGYVEIVESSERIAVRARTTARGTGFEVIAPEGCRFDGGPRLAPAAESLLAHGTLACDGPLEGRRFTIRWPGLTEVVVLHERDGQRTTAILRGTMSSWDVPSRAAPNPFPDYARLGLEHIAGGLDHLLFLFLLVVTVRRLRDVLLAETAFTLSHTVSFTLTATGLVRVPAAPTEILIALSIAIMAWDAREKVSRWTATGLALLFGVFHGLGFAGGLRELGLPETQIGFALAGFAVGVELGQIAFILVVVLLGALSARLLRPNARLVFERAAVTLAGGYAVLLVLERSVALLRV